MDFQNPTYHERSALHEAGHAVVASFLSHHPPPVEHLALAEKLNGGGHCEMTDVERALADPSIPSADLVTQMIAGCAGGMLAEEIAVGSFDRDLEPENEQRDEGKLVKLGLILRRQFVTEALGSGRARRPEEVLGEASRRARERFEDAFALAAFHLRAQWGGVERVAQVLLELGALPGEVVRTLIETAPSRPRLCETIEEDLALARGAERADPALRGISAKLRQRMAEAELANGEMMLRVLDQWEPSPAPLRFGG